MDLQTRLTEDMKDWIGLCDECRMKPQQTDVMLASRFDERAGKRGNAQPANA